MKPLITWDKDQWQASLTSDSCFAAETLFELLHEIIKQWDYVYYCIGAEHCYRLFNEVSSMLLENDKR